MNKFQTIIRNIVNRLRNKNYVDSVLLFGSCVRNINSQHNDIDFYVLINQNWRQRKSYYYKGILVELFLNPYDQYLFYFKNDEHLFTPRMFVEGKILFDRNGRMLKLKKIAKKILNEKMKLTKDVINEIRYQIADINLDIENELKINKYQALYLINKALEFLMIYHFKIKKIPEPKYNYIIKKVKKINPKLYTEIRIFFDETNPELRFKILKEIEKIILKPIGQPKLTWISSKNYTY